MVLEPRAGCPRCYCVRVCPSPVLILGFCGRRACSHPLGMPLQEVDRPMKVLYEHGAGLGVHRKMIKVGIHAPGDKPWARESEVLQYGTFTGVLQQMAADLRKRGHHPRGDGGQRGLHRAGVLRAGRAGLRRGRGDQPGARQGAERPQDRWRTWRSAACGPPASWPACPRRWWAGAPITTRWCAGCTRTGSPSSTRRSPGWRRRSRSRSGWSAKPS